MDQQLYQQKVILFEKKFFLKKKKPNLHIFFSGGVVFSQYGKTPAPPPGFNNGGSMTGETITLFLQWYLCFVFLRCRFECTATIHASVFRRRWQRSVRQRLSIKQPLRRRRRRRRRRNLQRRFIQRRRLRQRLQRQQLVHRRQHDDGATRPRRQNTNGPIANVQQHVVRHAYGACSLRLCGWGARWAWVSRRWYDWDLGSVEQRVVDRPVQRPRWQFAGQLCAIDVICGAVTCIFSTFLDCLLMFSSECRWKMNILLWKHLFFWILIRFASLNVDFLLCAWIQTKHT